MKNSYLTYTDQFCGGGGSSQGVRNLSNKIGGGVEVKLALNHWDLAIETHNTNFQDTLHDCTDISACDPRRYPSTDFLITSPECTEQTDANGKKKPSNQLDIFSLKKLEPAEERSRATMWDVVRFAEYHDYNSITVENVVQARKWRMFEPWLNAMHVLGYQHKCLYLNSMHFAPCPQSRDRMYIVFWKKGNKAPDLEFTPKAYCHCCEKEIEAFQWFKPGQRSWKYRFGYVYRCPFDGTIVEPYYYAAFNCIDWSVPGRRIGDIKLSPKTINRIKLGREKFWNDGIPAYEMPMVLKTENSSNTGNVRKATEPLQTQCTRQTMGILTPMLVELNRTGKCLPVFDKAVTTITAGAVKHGVLTAESFNSFISYYNGGSDVSSGIMNPAGAFTTTARHGLFIDKMPDLEDCYYRTLRAHEVKIGMAFDKDYIILGDSRQQVKQCGNAVTPPVMEWIQSRVIEPFM
ncbi:multidrug DMT transporter [Pedobacter sp. KBW01]|uniref:DNA cytosine methyltransferase n=1 Tax=Pedobacter sp. KBW01 TaxID=2153364 RepID=UPI000F5AF1A7|nr:DNA cytosine methyltransferase [Pedobacter sp. KBW01]RQO78088.1 multidrug DMT transporter [Pedobacter sp. KBW01]